MSMDIGMFIDEIIIPLSKRNTEKQEAWIKGCLYNCAQFPGDILNDIEKNGIDCSQKSKDYLNKHCLIELYQNGDRHLKFNGEVIGVLKA